MTTAQLVGNIRDGFHRQAKEKRDAWMINLQVIVLMSILVCLSAIVGALHFDTRSFVEPASHVDHTDQRKINSLVTQVIK